MAHVNRKEYWTIFVVLFILTILEVGIVYMGVPKTPLFVALSGFLITGILLDSKGTHHYFRNFQQQSASQLEVPYLPPED